MVKKNRALELVREAVEATGSQDVHTVIEYIIAKWQAKRRDCPSYYYNRLAYLGMHTTSDVQRLIREAVNQ